MTIGSLVFTATHVRGTKLEAFTGHDARQSYGQPLEDLNNRSACGNSRPSAGPVVGSLSEEIRNTQIADKIAVISANSNSSGCPARSP